jgi:hypothetical protein
MPKSRTMIQQIEQIGLQERKAKQPQSVMGQALTSTHCQCFTPSE